MTMAEKILAKHAGKKEVVPGEYVWAKVDETSPAHNISALEELEKLGIEKVFDSDRVWQAYSFVAPPQSVETAEHISSVRRLCKKYGIRWFEYGRHGIIHQIFAENGYCVPGDLVAMEDSHTTNYGVFNVASCPIYIECTYVMATGKLWFKIPESIKFWLEGYMPKFCTGKDIILKILGEYGPDVALYKSVEFLGPLASEMSLASRWTITTMGVEIGAKFAMFEADEKVFNFLKGRTDRTYTPVRSDSDAKYVKEFYLDATDLEPLVACPHDPSNVKNVTDVEKQDIKINQAFLGSCVNGRQEDLELAAKVLEGNKVHPDVRMIISPASMEVWRDALEAGWLKMFVDAGALVCHPTCGPCGGIDMGILASDEVCISSSCRNFQGRMGSPQSEVYLGNPLTVAASAIAGKIVDPRKYF